ncbi:hydroxymyristoyl-ACP dehydratase [Candidatus Methylocalor cossyra]|uniref:3-hydroxydecanoyl-(Acyl-carrier-protein) dehydratase, inferred for ABFAE pathway n=1 Tax=Candidatus Methylocalor cossyra TaxID=3108543 RepID=A0ABM9NHC9_9GAMM
MALTREQFAHLLPHRGAMSLLDQVVEFDPEGIRCLSATHRAADHPLRRDGVLSGLGGIEYAAQAMGLHGALMAQREGRAAPSGYLALVKDVRLPGKPLDRVAEPLEIAARRLALQSDGALYRFEVCAGGQLLLSGEAAILFRPGGCP